MGVLEEEKFKRAMKKAQSCARERFTIPEEVLADADKILDRLKSPAISFPRELILPLFGRSKDDDTQISSVTYCINEKIRSTPELKKHNVQVGYVTEDKEQRITFKRIDWRDWEAQRDKKDD